MLGKSKFDYEIENFTSAFQEHKDERIVLYGTGRMTAALMGGLEGFHIIGLCDRDSSLVGKEMYGLPILGQEDVEKDADCVIINTSETYWNTIYHRISGWQVPIYFRNGELAEKNIEKAKGVELEKDIHIEGGDTCWEKNYATLQMYIREYDIISFDIFGTLVVRKTMLPMDVFKLIEKKLDKEYGMETGFVAVRKQAAVLSGEGTLDEIYRKMEELKPEFRKEMERWEKIEIEMEKKLLTGRKDMVCLCREIMKEKKVFFVSDMYYPNSVLQDILKQICGLDVEGDQILVSCEQRKSKADGTLWKYYRAKFVKGRKALHIGDDRKADIERAQEQGIMAFHIMSPYEMLQKSSIKAIVPFVESLYSSIAMGLVCTRLFNSPFALHETKGKIKTSEKNIGYCLLGSLLYSFLDWLIGRAAEDGIRELIFFAREGYLLIPLYEYLKELKQDAGMPESVYLEISRRAVWNASIFTEEDIYEIAEFPHAGNIEMFLKDRFGIEPLQEIVEDDLLLPKKAILKSESKKRMLQLYRKEILERSRWERVNYRAYFDSLDIGSTYAVVDSQFYGSTQHYLGKVLNKKMKGYYFCVCTEKDNQYLKENEMYGCFQGGNGGKAEDTNVHRQAQFLEAFFTSPEGMLEYIGKGGCKKYAVRMSNQKHFHVRLEMAEGIKEFIKDMEFIRQEFHLEERNDMWSDALFGCFMEDGFEPTEQMKESFYFDNGVMNHRESPIWE